MWKSFKYKAEINKETEANCFRWLNLCRTLYNAALEQRIIAWRQHHKNISKYDQGYELPELKKQLPEFKNIDAQCLRNTITRLNTAYQSFFRRVKRGEKPGFPRFKSKLRYNSFTLLQNSWKLKGKYLTIKKLGIFKLRLSRPIEGDIKSIIIKRTPANKWFVTFSCNNVLEKKLSPVNKSIGLDVGLKHFLTDSENNTVRNPRFFRTAEKLLRRRQRRLSRRKRGSKRRNKARHQVAKAYEKITNQRKDFLHKVANHYIKNYDIICVEKLSIKSMVQNHRFSKSISDVGWGVFFEMLAYKAEEAGRKLIKVPPQYTSQKCSGCGEIVKKSLSVRTHVCQHCGLKLDRDHNAALNILRAGQARQTLTPAIVGVV
jgi:putative transposase